MIRLSNSLAFNLALPTIILGVCTLAIVSMLVTTLAARSLETLIDNEHQTALDLIYIASETDSSPENLQRVAYNVASRSNVKDVVMIEGHSREVIVDSKGHQSHRSTRSSLNEVLDVNYFVRSASINLAG